MRNGQLEMAPAILPAKTLGARAVPLVTGDGPVEGLVKSGVTGLDCWNSILLYR
jgi:hypothetical protein